MHNKVYSLLLFDRDGTLTYEYAERPQDPVTILAYLYIGPFCVTELSPTIDWRLSLIRAVWVIALDPSRSFKSCTSA